MTQQRRFSLFSTKKVWADQHTGVDEKVASSKNNHQYQGCISAEKGTPDDFKEAIKIFSEINPPTIESLYLRGNAHLKFGGSKHNQEAVNDFSEALRYCHPRSDTVSLDLIAPLYYKRGFAHQLLGENDQAISDYSEFIKRASSNRRTLETGKNLAKGYLSRGLVYESLQDMKTALRDIEKAISLVYDKNPYYEYCRERVRIAMSERNDDLDDEDGETVQDKLENTYDKGDEDSEELETRDKLTSCEESESERVLESDNDKHEREFYHALLLSEQGKYKEASERFEHAFNSAINDSQKANSLFREGLCQYELGQKTIAQNLFEKAQQFDKKHPRAIFRLGMIQVAEGQLKEALKTLSSAHKYAPNHIDILHERANVFEKLGRLDAAMYDRRRAMQLGQSISTKVVILKDRLRYLKAEVFEKGESAMRHLRTGWILEALHKLSAKTTILGENMPAASKMQSNKSSYQEAVKEYKAAIATDSEHLCPEAHALLAFCQARENDFLPAFDAIQNLFTMFNTYPESIRVWQLFVQRIGKTNYWKEMGAEPSKDTLIKVQALEKIRKDTYDDEKSFMNDGNNNRVLFYRRFRIQLSNVLAAFALAGCTKEILVHNLKGPHHKVAGVIKLISKGIGHVSKIGWVLESAVGFGAEKLEDRDHQRIKNKLQLIGDCGDVIEQCEVASRVARRLADRYKDQLIRLCETNEKTKQGCCSWLKHKLPYIEPIDENPPAQRVPSFAVHYIISAVADESVELLGLKKVNNKDALVYMLTILVSRAHGPKCGIPKCIHADPNQILPLIPQLQQQHETILENQVTISNDTTAAVVPIDRTPSNPVRTLQSPSPIVSQSFVLYEFFRAPGIRYQAENLENEEQPLLPLPLKSTYDEQVEEVEHSTSNNHETSTPNHTSIDSQEWAGMPYMDPKHYGYRLGSRKEIELLEQELTHMDRSVPCTNCCC